MLSLTHGLEKGVKLAIFMHLKDFYQVPVSMIMLIFTIKSSVYAMKPVFGYLVDYISSKIRKVKFTVYLSVLLR